MGFVLFWFHLWWKWRTILSSSPFHRIQADSKGTGWLSLVWKESNCSGRASPWPMQMCLWDCWNEGSLLSPRFWHTHPSTLSPFCCQPLGADLVRSLPVRRLPLAWSYPLIPFIIKGVETVGISKCSLCLLKLWETLCTGINQRQGSLFI